MFMLTAAVENTNLQLEHVALLIAQADRFYIMLANHKLLNNGSAQSQPRVINIDVPSKYGAWAVKILKLVYRAEH